MRLFLAALLLGQSLTTSVIPSSDGKTWLAPPPADGAAASLIPKQDVCEVDASKRVMAVVALDSTPILPLDQAAATSYAGACFQPSPASQPYLVRAVSGQRVNGVFSLHRRGEDLLIEHSSLMRSFTSTKAPLVVNLPFVPKHVYVSVSVDE